ncbi:hypothetical protein QN277_026467 [Acacia crassicarpa]|uniref:RING-type E3 ubiquitin transferase n=1 Tax=Acacia crassicarpa TaxID=499986 RepID=A0AAE1J7Z8_9FABA|nr:hypothetical protein QN277_026467 [Acacia crassicarpa]
MHHLSVHHSPIADPTFVAFSATTEVNFFKSSIPRTVGSSYWCYRCNRFVRVTIGVEETWRCPDCGSGFIEEIRTRTHSPFHRFPSPLMYADDESIPVRARSQPIDLQSAISKSFVLFWP